MLNESEDTLVCTGRVIFAISIIALGVETWVIAQRAGHALGPQYDVINCLPWLPAHSWIAYLFGGIWIACGAGFLFPPTIRLSALALGTLLFACTVILEAPKNAVAIGDISLRTIVFEPLSIACLALLIPDPGAIPGGLVRASRYLLALSFIIFGIDHFFVMAFIASLIPNWIPWHLFWSVFFGAAFIAGGVSIGLNWMARAGAIGVGLMFGIWVVTLHLPRVLGLYGIPGAPTNPDEWSSLFIAVALWGGPWAIARRD